MYGEGIKTEDSEETSWLEALEEQGLVYRGGSVWDNIRKDIEFVLLWSPRPSEVVSQIEHLFQVNVGLLEVALPRNSSYTPVAEQVIRWISWEKPDDLEPWIRESKRPMVLLSPMTEFLVDLTRTALQFQKPLLPVTWFDGGTHWVVGPAITRDEPCWFCFFKRYLSHAPAGTMMEHFLKAPLVRHAILGVDGMLHMFIPSWMLWACGLDRLQITGRVLFVDRISMERKEEAVLQLPNCPVCGVIESTEESWDEKRRLYSAFAY
ncbi:MAG: hypothetical protein L3J76_01790 [Candidatus Hydrothermae bacterium]|nr:hypothetical protein [Candidatus Hydrothermae bacterium]